MKRLFAALVLVLVMACVASADMLYINDAGKLINVKSDGTEESADITSYIDVDDADMFEFTLNGKSMVLIISGAYSSDVYIASKIEVYDPDDISAPVSTSTISSAGFSEVTCVAVLGNSIVLSGYSYGNGAKIIEVDPNTCAITNTYTHFSANDYDWFASYVYAWDGRLIASFEARTDTDDVEETVIMDTFGNITTMIEDFSFDDGLEVSGGEVYAISGTSGYEHYNENPTQYGVYRVTEALRAVNANNATQILHANVEGIYRDGNGGFYYTVNSDSPYSEGGDYLTARYINHWNGSSSTNIYDAGSNYDITNIAYDINSGILYAAIYSQSDSSRGVIALTPDSSGQYSISRSYPDVLGYYNSFAFTGNPPDSSSSSGNGGTVTRPESPSSRDVLYSSDIIPVSNLSDDVLDNLVALIPSIDKKEEIHYITKDNLSSSQNPTQKMTDQMKDDGYEPVVKFDTVTVNQDGYYVFEVIIPDEYVSMDIDSFRVYAMGKNDYQDSFFGIINGALNYGELTTMTGLKPQKLGVRMLAIGFLQGSQPFSIFLAKAIIALLTGGLGACNLTGAGIVLCLSVVVMMIHRKR